MTLATPDATRTHAAVVPCREASWGQQHIAQNFDNLIGSGAPGLGFSIDFLERMHDILVMQSDVRLAQGGTVAGIKGGIPLLVLRAKTHHHQVALLDQGTGTDGIDLGRLVVAPEASALRAQMIACGVTGRMVGYRRGEHDIQAGLLGATLNLGTPVSMNLAR